MKAVIFIFIGLLFILAKILGFSHLAEIHIDFIYSLAVNKLTTNKTIY